MIYGDWKLHLENISVISTGEVLRRAGGSTVSLKSNKLIMELQDNQILKTPAATQQVRQ